MPKQPKDARHPDVCSEAGNDQNQLEDSKLEWFEKFHVWNFISAKRARGKPDWFTEKRYPLDSRSLYNRWGNPDELVGVRFERFKGGTTSYALLDIDWDSTYHPRCDIGAYKLILESLEDIGLCKTISICSSSSAGLHVYFPFPKDFDVYRVAATFQICLGKANFEIKNGQLEVFPNVKASNRSLFKAHRLPLQAGSYVLDGGFNQVHNSLDIFIESWEIAAKGQDIESFETAIAHAKISRPYGKGDPGEWKERLEHTLAEGWTGRGQTNRILKEVCIFARVFEGLAWEDVETYVVNQVRQLPGYQQYCSHQNEIARRTKDWVQANRKSDRYYPFGRAPKKKKPTGPNNEDKKLGALERIKAAIAHLRTNPISWPKTVRGRQKLICKAAGCSSSTLYRYRELWHPKFEIQSCVTDCPEKGSGHLEGDRGHQHQESFEMQSRVTSCPDGDTEILEVEKFDQDNARADEEQNQSLVTVEPVRVRAISQLCLELTLAPEMPIPTSVTDPSLLSVISDEGQAPHHLFSSDDGNQTLDQVSSTKAKLKSSRSIQKPRSHFSQRNKYKQATFNFESHNQLKQTPQIQPNQIVRRKADGIEGPRFKVKQIQSNGRVWLQWLDEKVPLVDVCSSINDLELIA